MSRRWTEAHLREARRRAYEIAAELLVPGMDAPAGEATARHARTMAETEYLFRGGLRVWAGFDADRINCEVSRVRGLAEGRLVHVTRIRRAKP